LVARVERIAQAVAEHITAVRTDAAAPDDRPLFDLFPKRVDQ
jgi:hypothetical protein